MHRYQTALILGTGRSGRAAEVLLRSEGITTVSICEKTTPEYSFERLHMVPDVAIISPGFALSHPWVVELLEHGIPLLSEMELGWSRRRCPVIAVTGSNGKSTLVKWLTEALRLSRKRVVACGNYGLPVSAAVLLPEVPDWLVVEVSSFQLETIQYFRPEIGVLLNVLPNHLDRHGKMENYFRIKCRLFENMIETDAAIVSAELFSSIEDKRSHIWKTFGNEESADVHYIDGFAGTVALRGTLFDNEVLGSSGAAAVAVFESCGLSVVALEQAAHSFEPLPHRMQVVAEIDGVKYVDDSKATNLAAMSAALQRCFGRVHLIVGGRCKERDFSFIKDLLARKAERLYLIGEASSAMQVAWKDTVECLLCETLEKAVIAAGKRAKPGDTVLLSPGCASFDQFNGFGERGDRFAAAVRDLQATGAS
jgi:UDP-N-acetylmuramoylalanine--D-glutamate ligase